MTVDAATAAPPPRKTVYVVQVMRGLAAAAVAVYHAHLILAQPQYGGLHIFGSVAAYGWLGVNFFFVLSGFIILLAHQRDIGMPATAGRYLWRRFVRVYPIYWIFTTGYVAAALMGIGYPDFRWTTVNMVSSYLLIPFDPAPLPPLQVAWTLFYEVTFYAFFLVLILHRRIGIAAFALWTLAILTYALVLHRSEMGPLNIWNIYFVVGMASLFLYRRASDRWAWPLLGAGTAALALLVAVGWVPERIASAADTPGILLILAVVFAAMLSGAALVERATGLRFPRLLLLVGDASFSIYLVHSPVLSVLAGLTKRFAAGQVPDALLFTSMVALSLIAGIVAHLLVERPLLSTISPWIARRFGPARAAVDAPR